MSKQVDVLAVLESCRDRDGLLNDTGRVIEWTMRKEREWRKHGMTECAADAKAAADARVAAKIERDRMKAEQAAEREERKRKALERKLDLTLRKFGRETGASYETVRQMIAHTIAETSKDKE